MKFKPCLIFLLAVFAACMFIGVAWSDDDDDDDDNPLPNLNPDCPFLIIIEAPISNHPTIAGYFYEGGCETVYNNVVVESCTLNDCDDDDEEDSILSSIASSLAATISSTVLVCAVCGPEPEDLADITMASLRQTKGDGFYDRMYKKWITGTKWTRELE